MKARCRPVTPRSCCHVARSRCTSIWCLNAPAASHSPILRNGDAVSVPCSTPKRIRPPLTASRWTWDATGTRRPPSKFLGLQQAGKLLREAGFGQGQYLARLPEDVGVGRGRGCDVRDSGAVPQFDGVEGAGHRVVGAPAVVLALTGGTAADRSDSVRTTATGADANEGALQIGWQYTVDRQRRVHAVTRLVGYGKV